jgi:hypothetical protein
MYEGKKLVMVGSVLMLLLLPFAYAEGTTISFWDYYNDISRETYFVYDTIYIKGSGYTPLTNYSIFLVYDILLENGMIIPTPVNETLTMVETNGDGEIPVTEIWNQLNITVNPYLPVGDYHIIIDFDDDGLYNEETDLVDEMTRGYGQGLTQKPDEKVPTFSTPEFPGGTIVALAAFALALLIYRARAQSLNPRIKI